MLENIRSAASSDSVIDLTRSPSQESNLGEALDQELDFDYCTDLSKCDLTRFLWHKPPAIPWTVAENLSENAKKIVNLFPLVRFFTSRGDHHHVVRPAYWLERGPDGYTCATRLYSPLTLGWAMTIHKAQGQTIPHLQVNLDDVFANGHSYVASSRESNAEHLQVLDFKRGKILASERVLNFHGKLPLFSEEEKKTGP